MVFYTKTFFLFSSFQLEFLFFVYFFWNIRCFSLFLLFQTMNKNHVPSGFIVSSTYLWEKKKATQYKCEDRSFRMKMRFFIDSLFVFLSFISLSSGDDILDNSHSSRNVSVRTKNVFFVSLFQKKMTQDFGGAEGLSTNPEEMKKMQLLHPKFRLMNWHVSFWINYVFKIIVLTHNPYLFHEKLPRTYTLCKV